MESTAKKFGIWSERLAAALPESTWTHLAEGAYQLSLDRSITYEAAIVAFAVETLDAIPGSWRLEATWVDHRGTEVDANQEEALGPACGETWTHLGEAWVVADSIERERLNVSPVEVIS